VVGGVRVNIITATEGENIGKKSSQKNNGGKFYAPTSGSIYKKMEFDRAWEAGLGKYRPVKTNEGPTP